MWHCQTKRMSPGAWLRDPRSMDIAGLANPKHLNIAFSHIHKLKKLRLGGLLNLILNHLQI
jgi:hypothetical protein